MVKFAGDEPIEAFPISDEGLHAPGQQEYWQESVALAWCDMAKQVGGFIRFGHTPNVNDGEMSLWSYVHTPNWIYGASRDFPKRPTDFSLQGMSAGGIASYAFDGKDTLWKHDGDEVAFDLRSIAFHEPIGLWPRIGSRYGKDIGSQHFEVANRVSGTVTVKGETFAIDGVGHRDHSWGERFWWKRKSHRWINGVFGPDLSFCFLTYHGEPETIGRFGYVIRDGVAHYSSNVDILVYMEPDGATHRGGVARITLADGEVLEFTAEPICKGFYAYRSVSAVFESPCRIHHKGRVGFGDFEISENCRAGQARPTSLINGLNGDGMFRVDGR